MLDFGGFSLIAAFLLALFGTVGGFIGARRRDAALCASAVHATYLVAFCCVLSLTALGVAFVQHDYRYAYVWRYSNNAMSTIYLISSVWGGMDGSLLLWAGLGAIYGALAIYFCRNVSERLMNWVVPVINASSLFFLTVVAFLTNPFRIPGGAVPADGNGLNPLLQNPSMLIHPPSLYLGFTGLVVPFALAVGALFSGQLHFKWVELARRWSLVAWAFLTVGIILGGNWAYIELGWGGFWAWDPVENASFLPWLMATAYIHSVMVEERRGMFKIWNVVLCVLAYMLAVFGTFLTRSGIVQSVHAFAESDVGWVFLVYLAILIAVCAALLVYRWGDLRPESKLESYLSREAATLLGSLVLCAICFATFWGVMFPVFSEALFGEKSVVGPPFFNLVNGPLFLVLIFLMGVGPLIAWRHTTFTGLLKTFGVPFAAGSATAVVSIIADPSRPTAAISFGVCVFVAGTILGEFHRGVRVRTALTGKNVTSSITGLIKTKPRRYGGLIVHAGVLIAAVSITASTLYKIEKDILLRVGQSAQAGAFTIQLDGLSTFENPNYSALVARMRVFDSSGKLLGTLEPERRFYVKNEESTTEVDIRMSLTEDLYVALAGVNMDERGSGRQELFDPAKATAVLKVFVNPLQLWLWVGGIVLVLGALTVLRKRSEPVYESAPQFAGEAAAES